MAKYEERKYREWVKQDDLITVKVIEDETDLMVSAMSDLSEPALRSVSKYRKHLKDYIAKDRKFLESLEPVNVALDAPEIVKDMARASRLAGVGPMASVAGAVSEFVARDLLSHSKQLIIENGGDIYIKTNIERLLGVYAGNSPFTGKIALKIKPEQTPMGICTSSGTVGHSLSLGKADAAIILSRWTALADAVATATGNVVKSEEDIQNGVDFARSIEGVEGVIVILGAKIGIWGDIDIAKI